MNANKKHYRIDSEKNNGPNIKPSPFVDRKQL